MKKHILSSIVVSTILAAIVFFSPDGFSYLLLIIPISALGGVMGGSIGAYLDQKFEKMHTYWFLGLSSLLGILFSWFLVPMLATFL
jgi:hypothetical protein